MRLSNSFDCVNHTIILYKPLEEVELQTPLEWIAPLLKYRKQYGDIYRKKGNYLIS